MSRSKIVQTNLVGGGSLDQNLLIKLLPLLQAHIPPPLLQLPHVTYRLTNKEFLVKILQVMVWWWIIIIIITNLITIWCAHRQCGAWGLLSTISLSLLAKDYICKLGLLWLLGMGQTQLFNCFHKLTYWKLVENLETVTGISLDGPSLIFSDLLYKIKLRDLKLKITILELGLRPNHPTYSRLVDVKNLKNYY